MAKKKDTQIATVDQKLEAKPTPKLTAAQYWEFKSGIADVELSIQKLENAKLRAVIKQFELSAANKEVNEVAIKTQKAKTDYQEFLSLLEKELGTQIKGKIINPINFSITSENDIVIPD